MNRFLCFLLGSALLIVPAFATLDSSPGECAARYGAGTPVKNGVPLQPPTIKTNTVVYKQGAFTIMVRFARGKAVQLSVFKPRKDLAMEGAPFTRDDLQLFLGANLGTWETKQTSNSTAQFFNPTRVGYYRTANHWLTLETKAYAEAERKDAEREMEMDLR